jgi:hypothetical protein
VEEFIVSEIFIAFKLIHLNAEAAQALPAELGHKFSVGQLHQVFTRHGKAVFGGEGMFEFQRMLIEIGAMGRVIPGKETDVYVKGNFEYTVAHELTLSHDDELCIHPLFSGIFSNGGRKKERPVYPYGTVLEDEDYRDKFEWTVDRARLLYIFLCELIMQIDYIVCLESIERNCQEHHVL